MKIQSLFRLAASLILMTTTGTLTAQDITGGTVKYQQTLRHDFDTIFGDHDNPRFNDWIASLPKESKQTKVLYFSDDKSLFGDDMAEAEALGGRLEHAMARARFMQAPVPELVGVYYDLEKDKKIEHIDFMTRDFLVSGEREHLGWKLANKAVKILGYSCMAAELAQGNKVITAYFASEIPFSAGPAKFVGLPGLILAVEIDGETTYLATEVDLTSPIDGLLVKPKEGKKVSQNKFEKIMAEKMEEYKATKGKEGDHRPGRGSHRH